MNVFRDEHAVLRADLYGPRLERALVLVRAGHPLEQALRSAVEEFFRDRQDREEVLADLRRLLEACAPATLERCIQYVQEAARAAQGVPAVEISQQTEEAIEAAFWAFDAERKRTGAERDAFKGQMRRLLRTVRT